MNGETFEGSLFFNSSLEDMRGRLEQSSRNSGVGISISKKNLHYFSPNENYVELYFDDDSKGKAKVGKRSFSNKCPHLIQECIGNWARKNGLWKSKLLGEKVLIKLEVVKDYKIFRVSKRVIALTS